MTSEIGGFLRQLRLEKGDILKDMAEKLNVSSAFLSAVENGKKKAPADWKDRISEIYNLNEDEKQQMINALEKSNDTVEINIKNASDINKDVAICFARQFDTLDEETTKKLFQILNAKEK